MKKKAIALALSLALMLSIFVPGTLAMGTESGKDATIASQQASVPQKTETPSEAVDSAEPSDPSEPVKPVEPSNPSTPTEEGKPTETTAPTDGNKPEETTAPTDGNKPEETTAPTEESKPDETTAPTEESKPTDIMPQIMAMIQQDILAGGAAQIPGSYFEIVGATYEGTFTVPAGKIEAGSVPKIEGYNFAGAYFDNAQIINVGMIEYQGVTYIYYTTYLGGVIANILAEGQKIELRYDILPVPISYTVTVDRNPDEDAVVDGVTIIPDKAENAVPGREFSFKVQIPRGYHATVLVDELEQTPKLGQSTTYWNEGNTIKNDGVEYHTDWGYKGVCGDSGSNVLVALTKDTKHTFSTTAVSGTENFEGDRLKAGHNFETVFTGDTVTWEFSTAEDQVIEGNYTPAWTLDSLQINGEDLKIPFQNNKPVSTTLSTGTVVTVTRELKQRTVGRLFLRTFVWYDYTVTATNCYEDLTVSRANLNAEGWYEHVVNKLDGVESFEYQHKDGQWMQVGLSSPFASEDLPNEAVKFRFALKPGYGEPSFKLRNVNQNDGEGKPYNAEFKKEDNKHYVTVNKKWNNDKVLIDIVAIPIDVTVKYDAITNNPNAVDCPSDSGTYNITTNPQILISRQSPHDKSEKPEDQMLFQGWQNGSKTYLPGDLVNLNDLVVTDKEVIFTAVWIPADQADKTAYELNILEKNGTKKFAHLDVYALKGQPLIIDQNAPAIQEVVRKNPGYQLCTDNKYVYTVDELPTNGELNLYLEEMEATITYNAVGPKGAASFGSVSTESEPVKVSSGTAQGSTPTAEAGFRFVGWYTDEGCNTPVPEAWVDKSSNELTPQKTGELWEAATYYAKFDYAYADLTITATGIEGIYGQQGTIYQVNVKPADGTPEFNFQIAINGNGTKKITDLPYGEYTVTPQNNWSWRYSDQTGTTVQPSEGNDGRMVASATFRYSLVDQKWLSGNAYYGN